MEASVIIPTYKKAAYLEYTLESLFHQSYDKSQYEVIVVHQEVDVDDGTEKIIKHFENRGWNLHYIEHPSSNRSVRRNLGINFSKGKIIIFLDDDCICSKNLIAKYVISHTETSNKVVIGQRREVFSRIFLNQEPFLNTLKSGFYDINPYATARIFNKVLTALPETYDIIPISDITNDLEKTHMLSVGVYNRPWYLQAIAKSNFACPWLCFLTSNISVSRDALFKVGLFDENFQGWGEEDLELGYRLFRAGITFDSLLDVIVYHQMHPSNWKTQLKEWFHNYIYFSQKYQTSEIYLRWQVFYEIISVDQYETLVRKINDGHLNKEEELAIKEQYDQFVINGGNPPEA